MNLVVRSFNRRFLPVPWGSTRYSATDWPAQKSILDRHDENQRCARDIVGPIIYRTYKSRIKKKSLLFYSLLSFFLSCVYGYNHCPRGILIGFAVSRIITTYIPPKVCNMYSTVSSLQRPVQHKIIKSNKKWESDMRPWRIVGTRCPFFHFYILFTVYCTWPYT